MAALWASRAGGCQGHGVVTTTRSTQKNGGPSRPACAGAKGPQARRQAHRRQARAGTAGLAASCPLGSPKTAQAHPAVMAERMAAMAALAGAAP